MATMFCTNCGGKHEYQGFAPNFCSKCGNPMNAKVSTQNAQTSQRSFAQKATNQRRRAEDVEEVEDENDNNSNVEEVPQIDSIKVDIEIDHMEGGFRAFDLESLRQAGKNAPAKRFESRRVSGIDSLSPTKYGSRKNSQEN